MLKQTYRSIVKALTPRFPRLASIIVYFRGMKALPNLQNPKLFSEKLMKIKLDNYAKNPLVWKCADKFGMREYAQSKGISSTNLPVLLGVFSNANEVNFDELPQRFVLKCSHGAGFNIICTDKKNLDVPKCINTLNTWLQTPFGLESAELHYNKVAPVILCERFIEPEETGALPNDYKIYCFNGRPEYILACSERADQLSKVEMFDLHWNQTHYIKRNFSPIRPLEKPECLPEMVRIAEDVSQDFPFVRVDFYIEYGKPILGEMTFTPHACVNSNMTKKGQKILGDKLKYI